MIAQRILLISWLRGYYSYDSSEEDTTNHTNPVDAETLNIMSQVRYSFTFRHTDPHFCNSSVINANGDTTNCEFGDS